MTIYNRISARRGEVVALNSDFYNGGVAANPFAVYRVEIYRGSVADANIVDAIDIVDPSESGYPSPLVTSGAGKFTLNWTVPIDAVVPDIYFDQWYWYGSPVAEPLSGHTSELLKQCNRFWVYPAGWYADGGLDTIRFAFEPLDIKFHKPELRPLEVGIMPLPLYDYNYNLVAPLIPYLTYTVSIWTENCESIVEDAPCFLKLRQGAYRSNPYVISYLLDTSTFLKGTYKYRVTATLPDGTTRVSGDFILTIS